jgi:hypothetical protein
MLALPGSVLAGEVRYCDWSVRVECVKDQTGKCNPTGDPLEPECHG